MRLSTLRLPDGAGSTLVGLFGREILKLMTIENNINNNNKKRVVKCLCGCQIARPCSAPRHQPSPRGRPARNGPARSSAPSRGRAPPPGSNRVRGWRACGHAPPHTFIMSTGFLQLHVDAQAHGPSLPTPALPRFLRSE